MSDSKKSPPQMMAEDVGAVIDFWTAPAVHAYVAFAQIGFAAYRSLLPNTAPSSFGKEKE